MLIDGRLSQQILLFPGIFKLIHRIGYIVLFKIYYYKNRPIFPIEQSLLIQIEYSWSHFPLVNQISERAEVRLW